MRAALEKYKRKSGVLVRVRSSGDLVQKAEEEEQWTKMKADLVF